MFNYKADKKVMKTLVILFADSRSGHMFDSVFAGKSAFDRSLEWAESVRKINDSETVVLATSDIEKTVRNATEAAAINAEVYSEEKWNVKKLLEHFVMHAREKNCNACVFAWADQPFVDSGITEALLRDHFEYKAEYTFADGYPDGLCPEVLDAGTAGILLKLSEGVQAEAGERAVVRSSIFDLIKTDINSFEIETVIADNDYRLFRMSFNCGTKAGLHSCQALFKSGIENKSIEEISKSAASSVSVLKTVPSYYNIQITDRINVPSIYHPVGLERTDGSRFMAFEDFKSLVMKISDFSESAVVSLSAWGEATAHPDFVRMVSFILEQKGLTALVETDGLNVTEEMCSALKSACDKAVDRVNGGDDNGKLIWIVSLDAFTKEKYAEIHGGVDCFEKAVAGTELLKKYFSESTYPQITRMNENESELEAFWRFWNDKNRFKNPLIIVQKYNSWCGRLPDRKPADLSPLERNPCWHIRRDMTVLADGTVCFCHCQSGINSTGNAFSESLEEIWERLNGEVQNHMNKKYSELCGKCDEYYTFNF